MSIELFWTFNKQIYSGVYHFDFMIINKDILESQKVGYIVVNTKTKKSSYFLPKSLLDISPNIDIDDIIERVIKDAKNISKTAY